MSEIDLEAEITKSNEKLPIDLTDQRLPLEVQIRTTALAIATRHCGDTVVSEGNLYQQLKMDGKLIGPLTPEHVINIALLFERYLWGEFSKSLAAEAMEKTLDTMINVAGKKLDDLKQDGRLNPLPVGQEGEGGEDLCGR